MNRFHNVSPVDYRYDDEQLIPYLSEAGFIRHKLKVECALISILERRGLCPAKIAEEIAATYGLVTPEEVYEEEGRVSHDIRALVNCMQRHVSDEAKPFVHLSATSFDISDTANALRYRDAVKNVLLPAMMDLEKALIVLAEREAGTLQIGRTHGQHGVPITFGFAIASFVDRLGSCIVNMRSLSDRVTGKFSGAVGAYNASSLFFGDPEQFEKEVLAVIGLGPGGHSTQIVQPEPLARLFQEIVLAAGVVGNLACDMRHLQRTEINEVCEAFGASQVGSSTMAHKRNPISWENIESMWNLIQSRMPLIYMNCVSEHQRDLTGSASSRTYGEMIAYAVYMMKRAAKVTQKVQVDHESMKRNLEMTQGVILAEPLYILLAAHGHPDAHEFSRTLSMAAKKTDQALMTVALGNAEFREYYDNKFTEAQRLVLTDPGLYVGKAPERALAIAAGWKQALDIKT